MPENVRCAFHIAHFFECALYCEIFCRHALALPDYFCSLFVAKALSLTCYFSVRIIAFQIYFLFFAKGALSFISPSLLSNPKKGHRVYTLFGRTKRALFYPHVNSHKLTLRCREHNLRSCARAQTLPLV